MTIPINDELTLSDQTRYEDLQAGMLVRGVVTVPGGSFLYRFASSKYPLETQLSSPWWFTEQEFRKLIPYFRLNPGNLAFIARMQSAVRYEWSDLNVLQKVILHHSIKGFTGPGKYVQERTTAGSVITYQAPPDLWQLYVPNLRDPATKGLSAIGQKVIVPLPAIPLSSGDAIDARIQSLVGKNIIIPGNPQLH